MRFSSWVRTAVLAAALLASGLIGCGRRGALEPPPDPSAAAGAAETADVFPRAPRKVPIARPHEPFILDPLL